jgi:3-oxoacyl-[acyl-carrier protein] reductase
VAVKADVSVPAEVVALFDKAEESFGGIDIIVNNAGIMQQGLVSVADTDDALFDRLFAINVKGTFNTLRLAAKRLRQGGRIVNFSTSVVGLAVPLSRSRPKARAALIHQLPRGGWKNQRLLRA